ncbi:MAG TPA: VanZ family protein [Gemmatimonadaceae bacterium]|nr:VanZ family protein [Gemmatimonadaceae bacterium]
MILAAVAAIVVLTLRPAPNNAIEPRWACVVCGTTGVADVLVNVLLYVPYGVGLTLAGMRPWRAFGLVVATTFAVELLQYRVLVGRDGTLSDVLTNSLGGGIGIALVRHWRSLVVPNDRRAAALALTASLVWAGALVTGARALDVSAETAGAIVWWRPVMPPFRQYPGSVLAVSVNGQATANKETLASPDTPSGGLSIQATVLPSRIGAPSAPMVWVGHGDREDIVLSQAREDLVARFQLRGARWRLVSPSFSLPHAFALGEPAVRAAITARVAGHALTIEQTAPNGTARRVIDLTPTLAWALLMPSSIHVGLWYPWISALWIGVLLFPLGYWAVPRLVGRQHGHRTSVDGVVAGAALAMAVLSLAIVPPWLASTSTAWWEWLSACGAIAAGGLVAFIALRFTARGDAAVDAAHIQPLMPSDAPLESSTSLPLIPASVDRIP